MSFAGSRVGSSLLGLCWMWMAASSGLAQPLADPAPAALAPAAGVATAPTPADPVPAAYSAPGLEPEPRISLAGDWRVRVGPAPGATRPAFRDQRWQTVALPGTLLLQAPVKENIFWLRRRFTLPAGADLAALALELGRRPGQSKVWLNGLLLGGTSRPNEPLLFQPPLPLRESENVLALEVRCGRHVGGLRWAGEPGLGRPTRLRRGLLERQFVSQVDGSTQTITILVPRDADLTTPRPLITALPGWNGNRYSFASSRLLELASARGWLVLTPDTRGNTLYIREAEQGVLEAIELVSRELPVDPDRIYLTGVSMGGAGALQVGYHFPDRFAAIAAYYGDSHYDLTSYTGAILGSAIEADRYSVLRFPANARNLPVLLIHAQDDPVSPFAQSGELARADLGLALPRHRLIAPARGGHTLELFESHLDEVMQWFEASVREATPARVSFRSNDPRYAGAYWLGLELRDPGRFGEADLSWLPGSPTAPPAFTVHRLDRGVRQATVKLGLLDLQAAVVLRVTIEEPLRGRLRLVGLTGVREAELAAQGAQDGARTPLNPEAGQVELPADLRPGSYLIWFQREADVVGPTPPAVR